MYKGGKGEIKGGRKKMKTRKGHQNDKREKKQRANRRKKMKKSRKFAHYHLMSRNKCNFDKLNN